MRVVFSQGAPLRILAERRLPALPSLPGQSQAQPVVPARTCAWPDPASGLLVARAAPFFAMADVDGNPRRKAADQKEIPLSPITIEVVRRIDALFEIERSINGKSAAERLEVRQKLSRPLIEDLRVYMQEHVGKLARGHDLANAFEYILKRWTSFTLLLEDGRVCLSNNAAERGLSGNSLGRKSWLFCSSDRGGKRAAAMYSLIVTACVNRRFGHFGRRSVIDRNERKALVLRAGIFRPITCLAPSGSETEVTGIRRNKISYVK